MDCYNRKTAQGVTLYFDTKPISVNAMYRSLVRPGARFAAAIKSKEYRDFCRDAGAELEAQQPPRVVGPYGCRIALAKGCRHDIDNPIKAFLDLLVEHGVTDDDSKCRKLAVWFSEQPQTMVQILSTKADADEE